MNEPLSIVFVIDDDGSVRRALQRLIRSVGLRVELFGSAHEFLERDRPNIPTCMILDIRLPGMSGRDFHRRLAEAKIHIPIIFITGHGDIPMTVRAMKAGAVRMAERIGIMETVGPEILGPARAFLAGG
ncbi:MAG: response regulator [Candidatus Sulfotelmatobacter sp.]